MLKLGGLIKHSLKDYPGKISCVIFTRGCDFRCPFCHNPGLIYSSGEEISFSDIVDYIDNSKDWLEGIAITGGEPLLNYDIVDMLSFLKRKFKLPVKVDTNGNHPEMVDYIIKNKLTDFFAMDIKHELVKEKYDSITGININIDNLRQSINLIENSGIDYVFRTTVIPGVHSVENIINIKKSLIRPEKYILQNFSNKNPFNPAYKEITPYTDTEFDEFKKTVNRGSAQ